MFYRAFLSVFAVISLVLVIWFVLMLNNQNKVHQQEVALATLASKKEAKLKKINAITKIKTSQNELRCLADNIYYEASHEPVAGKVAVAFVTLNRVNHHQFPDSVCDVVYQKTRKTCQFSWVCGVNKGFNRKEYELSLKVAGKIYRNYSKLEDISNGSLYYHADYVNPRWATKKYFTRKIGRHLFYTAIPERKKS